MSKLVYAIATMDTKGEELQFVADCLRKAGIDVRTVDVGTGSEPTVEADVSRRAVIGSSPLTDATDLAQLDRGSAVTRMGQSLARYLATASDKNLAGVIGIGGSGGTALITTAMRELPIGLPKVMVSTMASGNTAPYVDCSDITMVYSVVDVAGINRVSAVILSNAANALAGMVSQSQPAAQRQNTLGMTMFGVTTACVDAVRSELTGDGYECLVFHATGSGGRAMEKLVHSGLVRGVLDVTTTEVADEVVGGTLTAGPKRFDTLIESQVPLVVSFGALDMVNFGAWDTVPESFRDRNLYRHNAQVTLMRTSPDENQRIARWMADKLNRATAPISVVVPRQGVSALDAPDQPFYDPTADAALFDTFAAAFEQRPDRHLVQTDHHINDPPFAQTLVQEFRRVAGQSSM